MTDPVVELSPTQVAVEPGGQARVVVTVVNEGSVVEGYRVEVLDNVTGTGPDVAGPAAWSEVLPAEGAGEGMQGDPDLTVYPGHQQSAVVVFSPPAGTRAPGGRCAFAIRVRSVLDPGSSTVVEGDVEIGKVTAVQARLVPVSSAGRWQGRHVVELSNWSNVPVTLDVRAEDPDRALGFMVHPDTVQLPVGASTPVRLRVRTRHPRLRGATTRLPFTVHATPAGAAQAPAVPAVPVVPGVPAPPSGAVVDGAFTQRPIASRGTMVGAGLLLAAVAGLAAYGLSLRSSPETFAQEGVPPTPQGVTVEPRGPEALAVSWAPVDQIEGYKLLQVNADGAAVDVQELDPALGAQVVTGLVPDQEYCFSLVAVRGELESPPSEVACQRTDAAPVPTEGDGSGETAAPTTDEAAPTDGEPTGADDAAGPGAPGGTGDTAGGTAAPTTSTGPTEGGGTPPPTADGPPFAAGEWAALLGTFPAQGSLGEAGATGLADRLLEVGVETVVIDTSLYPDLVEWVRTPAWLVVQEEPYASRVEAASACTQLQAEVNQPGQTPLITFCDPPVLPIRNP